MITLRRKFLIRQATVLSGIILLLVLSPLTSQAAAQTSSPSSNTQPSQTPPTGVNLELSPTFLSLLTDPGEAVSSQFRVRNGNNFTEHLRVSVAKFTASSDGSSPVIADMEQGDEFAKWIAVTPQTFSLDPNETKTITIALNPPKSAALGYYYALLISRVQEKDAQGQTQAVVSGSPAISVLLNVKSPNAKRELQVVDFKTDKLFYEYLPTVFKVDVRNTGNVHVVPVGDIFLDSGKEKELAILQINPGKGNVLPQTTRTFTAMWNDGFAVRKVKTTKDGKPVLNDKGEPQFQTVYDFTKADKFRIGKYTANLLLVYDNGERDIPVEATVSFWVIPWKILLGVGVIVLLVLLGLKSLIVTNIKRVRG